MQKIFCYMSSGSTSFKHFLEQVKKETYVFNELEQIIEKAKKVFPANNITEKKCLDDISREFYYKAEGAKASIKELEQSNPDMSLDRKKALHINSLYTRLCIYIDRFTRIRRESVVDADKQKSAYEDSFLHLSPVSSSPQNKVQDGVQAKAQSSLQAPSLSSTFSSAAEHKRAQNEDIYTLLTNLSELEVLSIELNAIIESSTEAIDRVSLETMKSNTATQCTNKTLDRSISRRRCIRRIKRIILLLLIITLFLLSTYFFTKILQIIAQIKKPFSTRK